MMLNNYETVFILTPVLSDSQMKDTADKFVKLLKDNGAEIINEENWGLKKLAYPINHKNTGFYYLIEFKSKPEVINILETEYRRDEKVMRFLTTKLDKYAVEYNIKRRKGEFKKSAEKQEVKS
ncbi:MAG: 30S ribosomal protein S6 [Cytophagaceae bacterium]|nr:30S ribosomal protein S6 [Cytophagaceae bacterium]MDW8456029.1 30S ribosomal protein S6 [Cytophagaceae bacterium]